MTKIKTVGTFREVMGTDWHINRNELERSLSRIAEAFSKTSIGLAAIIPFNHAFAATSAAAPKCHHAALDGETFRAINESMQNIFDMGIVTVIMFAGALLVTGHKPRAMEILIGCGLGTLVIKHAEQIYNFFSCLV